MSYYDELPPEHYYPPGGDDLDERELADMMPAPDYRTRSRDTGADQ